MIHFLITIVYTTQKYSAMLTSHSTIAVVNR
jgi:hypothetical protein